MVLKEWELNPSDFVLDVSYIESLPISNNERETIKYVKVLKRIKMSQILLVLKRTKSSIEHISR